MRGGDKTSATGGGAPPAPVSHGGAPGREERQRPGRAHRDGIEHGPAVADMG